MTERSVGRSGGASRELTMEMVQTLLAVIEEKDPHLRQHCERVANTCAHFCEKLSVLPPKEIDTVYFAALLHDLGLIFGPSELTPTSEDLNAEGQAALKAHPALAEKLLFNLSVVSKCLPIIRHHHEAWDGSGYPDRKKGEDIPLGARLIALCDRFDWLTSPRFPHKGVDTMTALEQIIQLSGKAFDGTLVDQFAQFIESTAGVSKEYMQRKKQEAVNIKEVFAKILQKFTSGKIVPPVMPQVVQDLQDVVNQPNPTADMLAAVIEREPVISLRLVSISNSPVYRGVKEIRTIREAIPRLGLKETMAVVMAIANKSLYQAKNPRYRLLMDRLWGHSIATAFCARLIGQLLKLGDVDVLFLMGLTHDIGKTFMLKAFSEEPAVKGLDMKLVVANIQEAHLGISNIMLKRWGFNDAFIRAVSLHEKNEFDSGVTKDCLVINLANMITRNIGYSIMEAAKIDPAELRSANLLGLAPETVVKLGEETKGLVKELAHLF
jgi:HD-GYP domain-containing protein (c-di-GMP phosphodiesterase class II)